ncbi:retrovirus-related Pol polyprotein LINE-1 [Elysia marginata]|uniref:Retrovirus-related Pol polyprotein LINE-1 n=1 Tax=Elysia marginata TaxID=1093978 RepID=A0AAV4EG82_9GAST|nr:retrovirus-related Pol polyprotein LINE-1 [Elysia marginata]
MLGSSLADQPATRSRGQSPDHWCPMLAALGLSHSAVVRLALHLIWSINIIERLAAHQKDLHVCFIDYTKAFDRVNYAKRIEVLTKAGVPDHERRLIAELYWNQTTKAKTNSGTTEDINILRGVRQGCILSSVLFNLHGAFFLQEALEEKRGISSNGVNITNVRYTDDTVIMAETPESLQQMLDSIAESCKSYGMEMNAK